MEKTKKTQTEDASKEAKKAPTQKKDTTPKEKKTEEPKVSVRELRAATAGKFFAPIIKDLDKELVVDTTSKDTKYAHYLGIRYQKNEKQFLCRIYVKPAKEDKPESIRICLSPAQYEKVEKDLPKSETATVVKCADGPYMTAEIVGKTEADLLKAASDVFAFLVKNLPYVEPEKKEPKAKEPKESKADKPAEEKKSGGKKKAKEPKAEK